MTLENAIAAFANLAQTQQVMFQVTKAEAMALEALRRQLQSDVSLGNRT